MNGLHFALIDGSTESCIPSSPGSNAQKRPIERGRRSSLGSSAPLSSWHRLGRNGQCRRFDSQLALDWTPGATARWVWFGCGLGQHFVHEFPTLVQAALWREGCSARLAACTVRGGASRNTILVEKAGEVQKAAIRTLFGCLEKITNLPPSSFRRSFLHQPV
jgi:hypothetical protein